LKLSAGFNGRQITRTIDQPTLTAVLGDVPTHTARRIARQNPSVRLRKRLPLGHPSKPPLQLIQAQTVIEQRVKVQYPTLLPLKTPRPPNSVTRLPLPTVTRHRPLQLAHPHPIHLVRGLGVLLTMKRERGEPIPLIPTKQRLPTLDNAPTETKAGRVEHPPGLADIITQSKLRCFGHLHDTKLASPLQYCNP
jgi:hypothetical protein